MLSGPLTMISLTRVVVEQPLQRAVAEHVVGQLGGEPGPLLGAERDVLLLDDLVELAEHEGAQLLGGQVRVVHPAAHALEQRLAHPVLQAGEGVDGRRGHGAATAGRGAGTAAGRRGADDGVGWPCGRREAVGEVHDDAARCLAR